MRKVFAVTLLCAFALAAHASITFNTFVSSTDINAAVGQNQTIGFTYAGNKFVGSVYFGTNNNQLYSTDLSGGNVQKFGGLIPGAAGEVVLAGSLGRGGFATGDIFVGSESGPQIYHIGNAGGAATLFTTLPGASGHLRGILFDPGSSFGGDMLVTTSSGQIYRVNSLGVATLLANLGEDTEGMDIATSAWGPYAGSLLVASEGSGRLRLISPTGVVTDVKDSGGNNITISTAETVSFVPQNLGASGNPVEGFYVANFAVNIQKVDASQFAGLQGDAIISSEFGSNSPFWALHFDGSSFSLSSAPVGFLPNQSEDGIFVTAQRINDTVPEPASLMLIGSGLAGLAKFRKKLRK